MDMAASQDVLYVVINPGKFLTVAVMRVRANDVDEEGRAEVVVDLLECAYEASSYGDRGIPDMARVRRFGMGVLKRVQNAIIAMALPLTAVLVRTPPPPEFVGAKNLGFIQCNTWLEGYVVGLLFSAFPNVTAWYVHPSKVRETFLVDPDSVAMASHLCGRPIDHEKTAACVLVGAHQFIKYCGVPLVDVAASASASATSSVPVPPAAAAAAAAVPIVAPVAVVPAAPAAAVAVAPKSVNSGCSSVWGHDKLPDAVSKGSGEVHAFKPVPQTRPKRQQQKQEQKPKVVFVVSEPSDA